MNNSQSLIVFGEVLFDHFPDGEYRLGGAPFNVAYHLQALGRSPLFISRVGDDPQARRIRDAMREWKMNCAGLQKDSSFPTGMVKVALQQGEPSYDIVHPCAYDHIDARSFPPFCSEGMLYHGTLALRDTTSLNAFQELRQQFSGQCFLDVNLRDPWWKKEQVHTLMMEADWVKLNQHELQMLDLATGNLQQDAEQLIADFALKGAIITCGSRGAFAQTRNGQQHHVVPQPQEHVVDAVGAGDAFTSVMVAGLLSCWPLDVTMERAQKLASSVLGIRGALPDNNHIYKMLTR